MRRSEDNFQESVISFHLYVGAGDRTEVGRLGKNTAEPLHPPCTNDV